MKNTPPVIGVTFALAAPPTRRDQASIDQMVARHGVDRSIVFIDDADRFDRYIPFTIEHRRVMLERLFPELRIETCPFHYADDDMNIELFLTDQARVLGAIVEIHEPEPITDRLAAMIRTRELLRSGDPHDRCELESMMPAQLIDYARGAIRENLARMGQLENSLYL